MAATIAQVNTFSWISPLIFLEFKSKNLALFQLVVCFKRLLSRDPSPLHNIPGFYLGIDRDANKKDFYINLFYTQNAWPRQFRILGAFWIFQWLQGRDHVEQQEWGSRKISISKLCSFSLKSIVIHHIMLVKVVIQITSTLEDQFVLVDDKKPMYGSKRSRSIWNNVSDASVCFIWY